MAVVWCGSRLGGRSGERFMESGCAVILTLSETQTEADLWWHSGHNHRVVAPESKPGIELRVANQHAPSRASGSKLRQCRIHQPAADSLPLAFGQHRDGPDSKPVPRRFRERDWRDGDMAANHEIRHSNQRNRQRPGRPQFPTRRCSRPHVWGAWRNASSVTSLIRSVSAGSSGRIWIAMILRRRTTSTATSLRGRCRG